MQLMYDVAAATGYTKVGLDDASRIYIKGDTWPDDNSVSVPLFALKRALGEPTFYESRGFVYNDLRAR